MKIDAVNKYNIILFCCRNALYATAALFLSGTIIQTFLTYYGIQSSTVGIHATTLNLVNILTTMIFSGIADRKVDTKKAITRLSLPIALCFLCILPLCLSKALPSFFVFTVIMALGIIQVLFIALRNIFEYKLPYVIIDLEYYGLLISVDGIVTGGVSIGVSLLLSLLLGVFPYRVVMLYGFGGAAVFMLLSAFLNSRLYNIKNAEIYKELTVKKTVVTIKKLLSMPVFSVLIAPNLLRGVASGVISMVAVIALSKGFTSVETAFMVTIAAVANILGSVLFALLSKRISNRVLCLIGSVILFILPFLCLNNKYAFLCIYFICCTGKIIIDYAIPTMIYKVIPFEIAGAYHAWRLILTTAGTSAATLAVGYLIDKLPIVYILIFATICQTISGLMYFFTPVMRKVMTNGRSDKR